MATTEIVHDESVSPARKEEDASSETSSSSSEQSLGNKGLKFKSPLNSETVPVTQLNSIANGHSTNSTTANSNGNVLPSGPRNDKPVAPTTEPLIREPPNLSELLNRANNAPSPLIAKEEDDDNEDEDDEEGEGDLKSGKASVDVNPERLKAFNMFVRLFVDENLDRLVPISKQPKEKISAIILSCQRQFPEFGERARKRIRTYLKSCRRSSRLKEPLKRTAENMTTVTAHIPSTQLAEVNACQNETHEAAKRARMETQHGIVTPAAPLTPPKTQISQAVHSFSHNQRHTHSHNHHPSPGKFDSIGPGIPLTAKSTPVKLSSSEVTAVRQLISGYRESAAFLYRSADELENLLRQSESYYGALQHKHSV